MGKWDRPCPVCGKRMHYQQGPGWVHTEWYLSAPHHTIEATCRNVLTADGYPVFLMSEFCGAKFGPPSPCIKPKGHDGLHCDCRVCWRNRWSLERADAKPVNE